MTDEIERLRLLNAHWGKEYLRLTDEIERLRAEVAQHKKWNTDIRNAALKDAAKLVENFTSDGDLAYPAHIAAAILALIK